MHLICRPERLPAAHEASEANLVDFVEVLLLESSEIATVDLVKVTLDNFGLQVARAAAPAVNLGQFEVRHFGHAKRRWSRGKIIKSF